MNRKIRLIILSLWALLGVACASNTLKVEVAPNVHIQIPTPENLKLVEGIYAQYEDGSLFIDTQYLDSGMSGDDYLRQIYGSAEPESAGLMSARKMARSDSLSVADVSRGELTGYLIEHKAGYELLVFAVGGKSFVTYVTGKSIPLAPVYASIKE